MELKQLETCESHLFIVFGGTGDLMERKLLPALRELQKEELEGKKAHILGIGRSTDWDDGKYRRWASEALAELEEQERTDWCNECLHYQSIGDGTEQDYARLRQRIEELEEQHSLPGNRVLYLALPPSAMLSTVRSLGEGGLKDSPGWTRLVIEKPFGKDLESAAELNRILHRNFEEREIFRIDHYLGKETVQNLLVFRFANPIFESLWNRDRISGVDILVAEEIGVEDRAGYYDRVGALRDMVQNHLTQLLALTAMEVPVALEANAIRDEKVKLLRAVQPIDPEGVTFGQYLGGGGERGYLEEEGIAEDSKTETFMGLTLEIANWRWQGVPFTLRTGKRLKRRLTRITVRFRSAPVALFQPLKDCRISCNELAITLQPDEGFDVRFEVKSPGEEVRLQTQRLRFRYSEEFGPLPDAYETLLKDILTGDQTLFVRADEAETAWKLYDPLLNLEEKQIQTYASGSWGPESAAGRQRDDG